MDILLAILAVVATVYAFALMKLQYQERVAERAAINLMFFLFMMGVFMIIAAVLKMDVLSTKVILTVATVSVMIAFMSAPIQDVAAYTVVYLRNMYNVGDFIRYKDYDGEIKNISLTTVTLENHVTRMRIELPHRMVISSFTRI